MKKSFILLSFCFALEVHSQKNLEDFEFKFGNDTALLHQPWLYGVERAKISHNSLDIGLPRLDSVYYYSVFKNFIHVGSRVVLPDSTQIIEHRGLSSFELPLKSKIVDILISKFDDIQISLWYDSLGLYRLSCTKKMEGVLAADMNYLLFDFSTSSYLDFNPDVFHYFKIDGYGLIGLQFWNGSDLKSLDIHCFHAIEDSFRAEFSSSLCLTGWGRLKGEVIVGDYFIYHENGNLKEIREVYLCTEKKMLLERKLNEFSILGVELN